MVRLITLLVFLGLSVPSGASAANILFVSTGTDTGIITVLRGDGHTVTMGAGGTAALAGDLSAYDAVYWSCTSSFSVPSTTFTNLTTFVTGGGRLFVTGYDGVISNRAIATLVGASSSSDASFGADPGPVTMMDNSMTTGTVDIRGVVPTGGATDRDVISGLMADTVEVVGSSRGTQWSLRTLGDGEVAYVSNGTFSGSHASWESTAPGGAGAYNAVVRNFASNAESGTTEPGAPSIEFSDTRGADEGSAWTLTVMVTDAEGDAVSWSWDTDDDGTFGELADMPMYEVAAGTTDGPQRLRIGVEAMDASGNTSTLYRSINIANVEPMITSTAPRLTSVGAEYRYQLEVTEPGGEMDPLTYTLVTGPESMAVSETGLVSWMPSDLDVTLPGETHRVVVRVQDDDEGQDEEEWELEVSPNRPPSAPRAVFPLDGLPLDELPRLTVENAQDPDLDTLVYFFELDRSPAFDSADLVNSGEQAAGVGVTSWTPEALERGTTYHWRAWASDGTAESPRVGSTFQYVNTPMPTPDASVPEGGVPDAMVMNDGGVTLPPSDDGCSCAVPGAGSDQKSHAPLALLALMGMLWARRRR